MGKKVVLSCSQCGSEIIRFHSKRGLDHERLELKKFCHIVTHIQFINKRYNACHVN